MRHSRKRSGLKFFAAFLADRFGGVAVRAARVSLGIVLMSSAIMPARADFASLREVAGKAVEEYQRIQAAAKATVARDRGDGSCSERASRLLDRVDEAVRLARLSSDIYDHPYSLQMKNAGQTVATFTGGDGRPLIAHRDPASEGYAEEYADDESGPVTVVFRGTRLLSLKDIMANVVQFADTAVPTKYRWAAALVGEIVAKYPGRPVIATGHSMGGGLAMYAAMRTPVRAVTFNPAGLSQVSIGGPSAPKMRSVHERGVAFIARSGMAIEPVSALSLAGQSAIVGRRYLVDVGAVASPMRQHDIARLSRGLEDIAANKSALRSEAICAEDLGYQRL